jgi:hypothetical protein
MVRTKRIEYKEGLSTIWTTKAIDFRLWKEKEKQETGPPAEEQQDQLLKKTP